MSARLRRAAFWIALASLLITAAAPLMAQTVQTSEPVSEDDDDDDDEDDVPATPCARLAYEDDETPLPRAVRLDRSNACFVIGGEARLGHHWQSQSGAGGVIGLAAPGGRLVASNRAFAFSMSLKLEAHAFTEAGRMGIVTETGWQTTQGDGLDRGLLQLRKSFIRFGGLRAGYGDSLTNFVDLPLLSAAFSPKRSVGFASYEWTFDESMRVAVGVETGPAFGSLQLRVVPASFDQRPFYVARFQRDFDGFEVHAAAVYQHSASRNPATGTSAQRDGFALTAGARFDVNFAGAKDDFSFQVTYARNAASYLGAAIDLNNLGSRIADFSQSSAASGIAAYTRKWTEQWSTTAFLSGAMLETPGTGRLRANSLRVGANLMYEPTKGMRVGLEVAWQDTRIERDPILAVRPAQQTNAQNQSFIFGVQAAF